MASSSSLRSKDQFQCCICLDVFNDPVTTPCGHNFCKVCLNTCWDTSPQCQCPLCKKVFPNRPELYVNTFIAGLAAQFKTSVHVTSSRAPEKPSFKPKKKVMCDICTLIKLNATKSCLDCGVSFCKNHLIHHKTKLKKHTLIDPVENPDFYICQIHKRPLELLCRDDGMYLCQFCTEGDHKTHNTVPLEEESNEKKTKILKTKGNVQQMIQERLNKIQEIKLSVKDNKQSTEKEKSDSVEMFRALLSCIERSQAELLELMEEKQKAAERQAEDFIKELEQEITELKRRDTELEQLSNTEDHLHLLQIYPSICTPPHTNNWSEVRINPHLSVETVRRSLCQLQKKLNNEMDKIANELQIIQHYAVDVTLDPDTANLYLILSDDGKQVTRGNKRQNLHDSPQRFDKCVCVLGKEGFSSGRFYYEVQVSGKTNWLLGVTSESSKRKGNFTLCPEDGYWTVCLKDETEYEAFDSPLVPLTLNQAPHKVGVFVDYEEGLVSFYDVEIRSHIYSFTAQSFTDKLYPVVSPGVYDEDENSAPLIITPVQHY